MTKRKLVLLVTGIAILTIVLIAVGLIFQQSDAEKRGGLSDVYDVDHNDRIGFVRYEEGKPGIYLKTDAEEKQLQQLEDTTTIADISFTPDDSKLLYSIIDEAAQQTEVHLLDVDTAESALILSEDDALITELAFHPGDTDVFYYLRAATFENYSPIASARPHDFDLYRYDIEEEKEERLTNLTTYSMESLQLADDGETAYIQMFEYNDEETAEETFEAKQRVFEIPLDEPEQHTMINVPEDTEDIYDFAMFPGEETLIYQAVSNMEAGGTFEYELFHYDIDTEVSEQLTEVKNYAGNPVLADDESTVYFIVNEDFAKDQPTFKLFTLHLKSGESSAVIEE